MAEITLQAESGRPSGSPAAKRLRREGRIPAVVYGHGIEPLSISVDGRELRQALSGESGLNALLNLKTDAGNHLAMAKTLQRHPVRNTVTHVDFLVVSRDEVVTADVPITLVGEAKAVQAEGGIVDQQLTTITVKAKPASIPTGFELDISGLAVGDAIRVSDLSLGDGVETDVDPEEAIVVAQGQQVSDLDLISEADAEGLQELADADADAEAADADAEGGEGEAAAEGDAPSEG